MAELRPDEWTRLVPCLGPAGSSAPLSGIQVLSPTGTSCLVVTQADFPCSRSGALSSTGVSDAPVDQVLPAEHPLCARHCVLISKQRRRKDDPRPQRVHSVKTHKWLTQRHVNGRDKRSARCASTGVAQDRGLPTQVAGLSFSNCPASYSRSAHHSQLRCHRKLLA